MPPKASESSELYNLRWNSYSMNMIKVFSQQQRRENLTDVTLSVDGQFIKAHRLVLSACSHYFQRIFEKHTGPNLVVCLDGFQFEHLELIIQFMYTGEVKVIHRHLKEFLALGKRFQVKGLCSVEVNEQKDKKPMFTSPAQSITKPTTETTEKVAEKVEPPSKKRKRGNGKTSTTSAKPTNESPIVNEAGSSQDQPREDVSLQHIPRPPNAFMIFANQWRKKLAVEYPNDSNKEISVRLGNMWKSLSKESKEQFYEDARTANEEHKLKYPGYSYSPNKARNRKSLKSDFNGLSSKLDQFDEDNKVEIKTEEDSDDEMYRMMLNCD